MKPTRLLVDASNLCHRMRHAHSQLRDSDGLPTGVLYGTLRALDKLIHQFDPDEILFVWEGLKAKNWRKVLWPSYKSGRKKRIEKQTEQELEDWEEFVQIQLPDLTKALRHMGIPQLEVAGLEADDVVGAIVREREQDSAHYVVVSTDRDMLQLAKHYRCRIYSPISEEVYYQNKKGALVCNGKDKRTEFAPSPDTWLLWRAIMGDTSDSIPGIEGVGEGTVKKLYGKNRWNREPAVREYLTAVELKGKRGKALEEGKEVVQRNLDMMDLCGFTAYRLIQSLGILNREVDYSEAIGFLQMCLLPRKTTKHVLTKNWPRFLREDSKYPNPMIKFFARRDFEFALDWDQWPKWVERYRVLYRRRIEMYEDEGYVIPLIRRK